MSTPTTPPPRYPDDITASEHQSVIALAQRVIDALAECPRCGGIGSLHPDKLTCAMCEGSGVVVNGPKSAELLAEWRQRFPKQKAEPAPAPTKPAGPPAWHADTLAIAKELEKTMQCNCDLDNWTPTHETGHSWVCRIHKAAMQPNRS